MNATVETILAQFVETNLSCSVYPMVSPQDSEYPFIVYKRRGGNTVMTMSGPSHRKESYTYTAYSRTMQQTQDLRNNLIGLMSGLIDQDLSIVNTAEDEDYDEALDAYMAMVDFDVINNTCLPTIEVVTGILSSTYTVPTASYASYAETSSYVPFSGLVAVPSLVSSSAQVSFLGLSGLPAGIVSSSGQFNSSTNVAFGQITASAMNVGTLVVTTISSSVDFSSGSNTFGNSLSNVQQLTGSVQITGSLTVNGQLTSTATDPWIAVMQAMGSPIKAQTFGLNPSLITTTGLLGNQNINFILVYLPTPQTLTGIEYFSAATASYTPNNYNGVGLYSISGGNLTRQATSSNAAFSGAVNSWTQIPFQGGPIVAPAGPYYIASLYCESAVVAAPSVGAATSKQSQAINLFGSNANVIMGGWAGQTTLPTSLTTGNINPSSATYYMAVY